MSDYHVLTGRQDGNGYQVVFHIPIPNVNNRVGVSYRTALVNSGMGGSSVMETGTGPGQIDAAELAQVVAGEIYEHSEEFATNPGETAGQIQTRIDARYTQLVTEMQSQVQSRLSYYGHTRDIP